MKESTLFVNVIAAQLVEWAVMGFVGVFRMGIAGPISPGNALPFARLGNLNLKTYFAAKEALSSI